MCVSERNWGEEEEGGEVRLCACVAAVVFHLTQAFALSPSSLTANSNRPGPVLNFPARHVLRQRLRSERKRKRERESKIYRRSVKFNIFWPTTVSGLDLFVRDSFNFPHGFS